MSFQRLDKQQLNSRLVVDGDEEHLGGDSSITSSSRDINPASSSGRAIPASSLSSSTSSPSTSASPPAPLISVFTSHSLNKALGPSAHHSHPSHNNPSHSSLAQGHTRDMELVDLGGERNHDEDYQDAGDPRQHVLAGEPRRSPRAAPNRGGGGGGDEDEEETKTQDPSSPRPPKVWPAVLRDGWKAYLARSFREFFLGSKLNILLLAVPIAILCKIADFGDGPLFVFSLLGLCPLAERIAFVTDELAMYTNDTVGGLLSATMGNATEMIVSIFALKNGLLRIVQLSLIGSVYSNLLLVQGSAFLIGGLKYTQQKFSQAAAKTNVALLLLSVMGLFFPMVLLASDGISEAIAGEIALIPGLNTTNSIIDEGITLSNELKLSRFASCWLLIIYALLILYQLKTHAHLFESREEPADDEEEPEPPVLGWYGSIIWALVVTIFISILSEFIVSAMDGAAKSLKIPVVSAEDGKQRWRG